MKLVIIDIAMDDIMNQNLISRLTTSEKSILKIILLRTKATRDFIQNKSSFGKSKIDATLLGLRKKGIIEIELLDRNDKGRKQYIYNLKKELCYFLGVEFSLNYERYVLIACDGSIVFEKELPGSFLNENASDSMMSNFKYIKESIAHKVFSIGLCLQGLTEHYSVPLNHKEIIITNLKNVFECDVKWHTPKHMVMHKEYRSGLYENKGTIINIHISHGLGMGIYINGKLYQGDSGMAGQIAHIPIEGNSNSCYCGNKGCLWTEITHLGICKRAQTEMQYLSEAEIKNKLPEKIFNGPDYEKPIEFLAKQAKIKDKYAFNIVLNTARILSKVLVEVVNILNPTTLVIHSFFSEVQDAFCSPIRQELISSCHKDCMTILDVRFLPLEKYTEAEGSAIFSLMESWRIMLSPKSTNNF